MNEQTDTTAVEQTEQAAPEAAAPSVTDLDGLSEFRFQGKSYTPEKLAKYFKETESLQSTAKYKEFADNLQVDLDFLLQDPSAIERFKQIYPREFHGLAEKYAKLSRPDASQPQSTPGNALPKEFLEKVNGLESKVQRYERMAHEAEVAKHEAYLQKTVDPLFQKYDFASSDAVYAKAESMIAQGYQMTDAAWERLIKENHSANEKRFEARHNAKVKEQIEKGNQAKDTGAGGSAPGHSQGAPATWEQARAHAYAGFGVKS
jgi:hypothetical protein